MLDFDRTIIQLFNDNELEECTNKIKTLMQTEDIPTHLQITTDNPFDFIDILNNSKYSNTLQLVLKIIKDYELNAVRKATITDKVIKALISWNQYGHKLAIVSNNSSNAIEIALKKFGLMDFIDKINGRTEQTQINDLKPNPTMIIDTLSFLNLRSKEAVFIGDSPADMIASVSANVYAIGVLSGITDSYDLYKAGASCVYRDLTEIYSKNLFSNDF